MRNALTAIAILCSTAGLAAANVQCNAHGAVVTTGNGAVLYLGKACDAAKKGGGVGKWWLTASAVAVEIDGSIEALIEFDIDCDLPACWAE